MKKLLGFLLAAALLFSLAVTVSADLSADEEDTGEAFTTDEETGETSSESSAADEETENTDPDTETTTPVVFVPSEDDLPEGYEVDEGWSIEFTLGDENGWSYHLLEEMLAEAGDDEYIYFVVEEDVPEGYVDNYTSGKARNSSGNIIIVTNVNEGEHPSYELPETGGIGTTPYTAAGAAILLSAAVYFVIMRRKQKESAE